MRTFIPCKETEAKVEHLIFCFRPLLVELARMWMDFQIGPVLSVLRCLRIYALSWLMFPSQN